jgi:lipopolysaccharide transport system permease protein
VGGQRERGELEVMREPTQAYGYPAGTVRKGMFARVRHSLELVFFLCYAELHAERARAYLGFVWWVLEPAMNMAVLYFVFGVMLRTADAGYVPFLLVGLTVWQWFKSGVSHGGNAIWGNLNLIRQVKLSPLVFPCVQVLADSVKFLYIFALLLVLLWCTGYPPNPTYLGLVPLLLVELVFTLAIAYLVAAVIPLVPDLRFVIDQLLALLMFLSAVMFSADSMPPGIRKVLMFNPIAALIGATRGILLHAQWPNWSELASACAISLLLLVGAIVLIRRLAHVYVKQAA